MSRRHAFRPTCPDTLEGRIAPSLAVPVIHVQPGANLTAHSNVKVAHASKSTSNSIDWHKVGTQVTDFLGFTHKAKPHAKPVKAHPTSHLLTR